MEDTACAYISHKSGFSSIFYGTVTHCYNSSIELEIVCEQAVLVIKNNELRVIQNYKETILAQDMRKPNQKDYYGSSHETAIRNFYKSLRNEGGSYVNIKSAAAVSDMIEAIMESAKTGSRIMI